MDSDIALSVVIPYYNEEKNIPLTIERLKTCLLAYPSLNIEFIFMHYIIFFLYTWSNIAKHI